MRRLFAASACLLLFCVHATLCRGGQTTVQLEIPVSYGPWSVVGTADSERGAREIVLTEGTHAVAGELGWQFAFLLIEGNVVLEDVVPGRFGRDLGGMLVRGSRVSVPPPKGLRALLGIPGEAGFYSIEGLLPTGKGPRSVYLADGETTVSGEGWSLVLTVADGAVTVAPDGAPDAANVRIENGVLLWTVADAPGDGAVAEGDADDPGETTLPLFAPSGRTVFRRDEVVTVALVLPENMATTDRISLSAGRDEEGLVEIWSDAPRGASPGDTVSLDMDGSILPEGACLLRAAVGETTGDLGLSVHAVPPSVSRTRSIGRREALLFRSADVAAPDRTNAVLFDANADSLRVANGRSPLDTAAADAIRRGEHLHIRVSEPDPARAARLCAMLATAAIRSPVYESMTVRNIEAKHLPALRDVALLPEEDILFGATFSDVSVVPPIVTDALSTVVLTPTVDVPLRWMHDLAALRMTRPDIRIGVDAADAATCRLALGLGADAVLLGGDAGNSLDARAALVRPHFERVRRGFAGVVVLVDGTVAEASARAASVYGALAMAGGDPELTTCSELAGVDFEMPETPGVIVAPGPVGEAAEKILPETFAAVIAAGGTVVLAADVLPDVEDAMRPDGAIFDPHTAPDAAAALLRDALEGVLHLTPGTTRFRLRTDDECYGVWLTSREVASEAVVDPPVDHAGAWDLLSCEQVAEAGAAGATFRVSLSAGGARLIAFLPATPTKLNVTCELSRDNENAALLEYSASLLGPGGRRVSAPAPAVVTIRDPEGAPVRSFRAAFAGGRIDGSRPLAACDAVGEYSVLVRSETGDVAASGSVHFDPKRRSFRRHVRRHSSVEIAFGRSVRAAVSEADDIWIVPGTGPQAVEAKRAAAAFSKVGKVATVLFANEAAPETEGAGLPPKTGRTMLLLGSADDNPLVRLLARERRLMRTVPSRRWPGKGAVWVETVWRAFGATETVVIGVSDPTGAAAGADYAARDLAR